MSDGGAMRTKRVLAAFLLAPLTPTVLVFLLSVYRFQMDHRPIPIGEFGWFLTLNALFAYPLALAAGVPVYLATRGTGFAHWALYTLIGVCLGYLLAERFGPGSGGVPVSGAHQAAMVFGGASVLVFWLIARPDQYRASR